MPDALSVTGTVTGVEEVNRALAEIMRRGKATQPVLRRCGYQMQRHTLLNWDAGKDVDGKAIAPVATWTRAAGAGAGGVTALGGSLTPLRSTGKMQAGLGIVSCINGLLVFGWYGDQLEKAERMILGIPGRMQVAEKKRKGWYSGIRAARKDGHLYCRVNTSAGWRTKQVAEDQTIAIRPRARPFFYFGRQMIADVKTIFNEWVARQVAKERAE